MNIIHNAPRRILLAGAVAALLTSPLAAVSAEARDGNWYLKPSIGYTTLGSSNFDSTGFPADDGTGRGEFDSGYMAGIAFGYRYGNGWTTEVAWEFRNNDVDQVSFSDGSVFTDGDYASNTIYLNGYYTFNREADWRPYVGAGIGYLQEIDIDINAPGANTSFSGDGEVALQAMAGVEFDLGERWRLQGEARYVTASGIDLDVEGPGGQRITDIDYDGFILGVNLAYDF
jgi:opacity protein-like surface antigen